MAKNAENVNNNLEVTINKVGYEIANIIDKNNIEKLLGVLVSDGVYAMWLYAQNKLNWKFDENKDSLKEQKLFKFLEQISILDEYVTKKFKFEKCVTKLARLTGRITELAKEIESLKSEKHKDKKKSKKKLDTLLENRKTLQKKRNDLMNSYFQKLSEDLNDLLFFREILERALIYARYHAKAMG